MGEECEIIICGGRGRNDVIVGFSYLLTVSAPVGLVSFRFFPAGSLRVLILFLHSFSFVLMLRCDIN